MQLKSSLKSPSKIVIFLIIALLIIVVFKIKRWGNAGTDHSGVITSDVINYYSYLPAAFIYKDLSYSFLENENNTEIASRFWPNTIEGGKKVEKMTMGLSFLYSPFFFLAHSYCNITDTYTPNGFSKPYEMSLVFSSIFYLFFGLWYLRKFLLEYFSEWITSFVLIAVFMGTNLYYYTIVESAMSHTYSFSLIAIFLYQIKKWHDQPSLKRSAILGLIGGLIILIRPINLLILIIPLLYNVANWKDLNKKTLFFIKEWKHLLLMVCLGFLIIFPQLVYWKYATGHWIFNSYLDERFYFNNPHVLEGLFSYRKGWFIYTPMMLLATIGIFTLFKSNTLKSYKIAIPVFFVLNIYFQYSWWNWWYGGSFGSRPLIDSYALMALPLGNLFSLIKIKRLLNWGIGIIVLIFLALNIIQTRQARLRIIHWNGMTKRAYWSVFLKSKATKEVLTERNKYISLPNITKAMKGENEYNWE